MMNIKDFHEMRRGTKKNLVWVKAVVIGYREDEDFKLSDSVAVGLIGTGGEPVAFYVNADQVFIPGDEVL